MKLTITEEIESLSEGGIKAAVEIIDDEGSITSEPDIYGMTIGGVGRKIGKRIVTLWEKRNAESQ